MAYVHMEVIDKTDLAEYANANDKALGTIPLEYGEVRDHDFDFFQIAYVESDFLGMGGFYTSDQGFEAVHAAIMDCISQQDDENLSEFVIPHPKKDDTFLLITVGYPPSMG